MSRFVNIIVNPSVLALFIAPIIIYFLPEFFKKYNLTLVHTEMDIMSQIYFHDLDHDSISEKIKIGYNQHMIEFPFLICETDYKLTGKRKFIDQINFDKPWIEFTNVIFGDYNKDGIDEVYLFTHSNDSLFLLAIDPLVTKKVLFEKYITQVSFKKGKPDFSIENLGLIDLNGDSYKEVIFGVTGGFSVFPRNLMAFDIYQDTLFQSENDCGFLKLFDYTSTSTGKFAFTPSSYCPMNKKDSMECLYSDYSSWLMVFDKKMNFLFPPIENKGHRTSVSSHVKTEDDKIFIYSIFNDENGKKTLLKFDSNGNEVCKRILDECISPYFQKFKIGQQSKLYLFNENENEIIELLPNLTSGQVIKAHIMYKPDYVADLDNDGKNERIKYFSDQKKVLVSNNNLSNIVEANVSNRSEIPLFSKCLLREGIANLFVDLDDKEYYFHYEKNKLYYLKYPVYIGIYALLSFFFYLIFQIQRKNIQQKFEEDQKMLELELLTIKNQIDPHFTFNAINTLSSIFQDENPKAAHSFLVDFSTLIRNTLKNSKNISISLKDEVDFIKNYIKLQQVRYEDQFDFQIIVTGEVNWEEEIPKMIIQTFAENAIKHGLIHKKGKGNLLIIIGQNENDINIEIIDDGIGRNAAKKLKQRERYSTGKGLDIINQVIDLYYKIKKKKVHYSFDDLTDSKGKARGTKVTIKISKNKWV